jgi:glycosyltransferase involved in cell wall biosynthesis
LSITVAIATYRRPRLLAGLLESLRLQQVEPELASALRLVVVDNDRNATARPLVQALAAGFPFAIEYAVAPERNISLARNQGVRIALAGGARFVAFIDDDEEASPGWLQELARVQRQYAAPVVWGTVVPRLPEGVPRWVAEGGFFDRGTHPTGTRVRVADTANTLVSAEILAQVPGPFDPAFGISGGGDSHFFQRAVAAGATIVRANDAVVYETVPAERATAQWILRRAFRIGNHSVCVERAVKGGARWIPARIAKATGRIVLGAVMLPAAGMRGKPILFAGLRNVATGLGAYAGIAGYRYIAYRKVDGS